MQAEKEAAAQANAHVRMLEQRVSAAEEDLEGHRAAAAAALDSATSAEGRYSTAEKDLEAQRDTTLAAQERLATTEERCRYGQSYRSSTKLCISWAYVLGLLGLFVRC